MSRHETDERLITIPADAVVAQCEQSQESVDKIREQTSSLRKALAEHRVRMADAEADYVKQLRVDRTKAESALKSATLQIELLERSKKEDEDRVRTLNNVVLKLQQSNSAAAQTIVDLQEAQKRLQTLLGDQSEQVAAINLQHAQALDEVHHLQTKYGELRVDSQQQIANLTATIEALHTELASKETNLRQVEELLHEKEQTVNLLEALRSADVMSTNEEASAALRLAANQVNYVVATRDSCTDDLFAVEQALHAERQKSLEEQRQKDLEHAEKLAALTDRLNDATMRAGALEMALGSYKEKRNVDGELLAQSVERSAMLEAQVASLHATINRLEKVTTGRGHHNVSQGSQTTFTFRACDEMSDALNDRQSSLILCEMQRAKLAEQVTLLTAQLRAAREALEMKEADAHKWETRCRDVSCAHDRIVLEKDEANAALNLEKNHHASTKNALEAEKQRNVDLQSVIRDLRDQMKSCEGVIEQSTAQNKRLLERLAAAEKHNNDIAPAIADRDRTIAAQRVQLEHAEREVQRFKGDVAKLYELYKEEHDELEEWRSGHAAQIQEAARVAEEKGAAERQACAAQSAVEKERLGVTAMQRVVDELMEKQKSQSGVVAKIMTLLQESYDALVASGLLSSGNSPVTRSPPPPAATQQRQQQQQHQAQSLLSSNQKNKPTAAGAVVASETDVLAVAQKIHQGVKTVIEEATFMLEFVTSMRKSIEDNVIAYTSDEALDIAIDAAMKEASEFSGDASGIASNAAAEASRALSPPTAAATSHDINSWIQGWSGVASRIRHMAAAVLSHQAVTTNLRMQIASLRGILIDKEQRLYAAQSKLTRIASRHAIPNANDADLHEHQQSNTTLLTNGSSNASTSVSTIDIDFLVQQHAPLCIRLRKALDSVNIGAKAADELQTRLWLVLDPPTPADDESRRESERERDAMSARQLADEVLPFVDKCHATIERAKKSLEWVITNCVLPESVIASPSRELYRSAVIDESRQRGDGEPPRMVTTATTAMSDQPSLEYDELRVNFVSASSNGMFVTHSAVTLSPTSDVEGQDGRNLTSPVVLSDVGRHAST